MSRIFTFLILLFCVTSCGSEDLLSVKVEDIKEPCECIDYAVKIAKQLEQLTLLVNPDEPVLWDCGEYYVDSLATEEERKVTELFAKRNEIHSYCIEKFDYNLLSKCAIEHPDLKNVKSESQLGYIKNTYSTERMDFHPVQEL